MKQRAISRHPGSNSSAGMLILCVLAAVFFFMIPSPSAYASDVTGDSDPLASKGIERCPNSGVANRFVPCIKNVIIKSAKSFFDAIYPMLSGAIYTTLTLAIIFFAAMLLTQWIPTPKASSETFMLLVKVGAVVWFTSNLQWIFDNAVAILDGLIHSVTTFTYSGSGGFALRCSLSLSVWERIDCILDRVIGISSTAGQEISNGIIGFLWDNAFSGAMGILIFLGGLYMIASLVMGMFRAIAQYLISLMLLSLIVMVGVIFIPLILFKQTAGGFFNEWLKQLMSVILQPVVVFAFLSVLVTALDVTMFSGPNSFYRTVAGNQSSNSDFSLSRYMEDNDLFQRRQAGPLTEDIVPPTGQPTTTEANTRNASNTPDNPRPRTAGSLTEILVGIEYRTIDWQKLQNIRQGGPSIGSGPPEEAMRKAVGNSLLMSIVTVFLLVQMMNQIPQLAQDLTGGVKESVSTGGLAANALSLGTGASNVAGNISQRIGNLVTRRGGAGT